VPFGEPEAGFSGTETGGKFPRDPATLRDVLAAHDLKLVSGWYSGLVLQSDLSEEKDRAYGQLELFRENGATVIVYGETSGTVQNKRDVPLAKRPKLDTSRCGLRPQAARSSPNIAPSRASHSPSTTTWRRQSRRRTMSTA
jgi:sugar phosphate isomerase/epimerase